jgi:hypothetical protein
MVLVAALAVALAGGTLVSRPAAAGAASPSTLTWSTLSPPLSPPPLAYASMAYDSDNATVVLFGGQGTDGTLSSDTWVWNGSTWTRFASAVPARKMAAMAFDPALHQLILFGGQGSGNQLLNDTWAWNGVSWVIQTPSTGAVPPPREGASLGFDTNDQLVLFGGGGAPGAGPVANGKSAVTLLPSASPPAASSGVTSGPGTAVLADSPLVTQGDTWVWTGSAWTQQAVVAPPARTDAAMAWDGARHQTILFGGSSTPVGAAPARLLGDTWVWGNGAWSPTGPPIGPAPRQDSTLVPDSDLGGLIAFGGATPGGPGNDTWSWNGQTWDQLSPINQPTARQGAAAAYDASAHQLILFGGVAPGGAVLGDTEILTAKSPVRPSTSPTPSGQGGEGSGSGSSGPATTSTTGRPGPGAASRPPTKGAGVTGAASPHEVSAREVRSGDLVTLSGSGFQAGAPITITFHSAPYLVGRTVADSAGQFSATVAVPTGATPGGHHFEATGMGDSRVVITLFTPVDVIAAVTHHRALQALVLVAVAIGLPIGTWLVMGLGWRRRSAAVEA